VASGLEPGLASSEGYKGMTGVDFFVVTTLVPNEDGLLKPGMSGPPRS